MSNKVLPRHLESEKLVLGTIVTEKNALSEVQEILTDDCFYDDDHRLIYRTIKKIEAKGDRADIVAVSNELTKIEGFDLMKFVDIAQNFTFDLYQHAAILHDKAKRRRFYEIGQFFLSNTYSESVDIMDVASQANDMIVNLFQSPTSGITRISDAISSVYKQIEKNTSSRDELSGTPTGFKEFDKKSGGMQTSDLVIIAGETSQGKTALALSMVNNMAKNGEPIAVYSLEMKNIQCAARMMAMESGIAANEILFSRFDSHKFERLDKSISKIYGTDIYFDDRSTSNIDTIISSIRTMALKYGIKGAVIDYLQILNVNMKNSSPEQQMGSVARRLKNLAKDLDIWIIALSQLNRDHNNPVPNLNRLRDSGQIAEAADIVMFVYRAEFYNRNYPEPFKNYPTQGTAMIDIAKGRNIGILKFFCRFDKPTTHFMDIEDAPANFTAVNYYEKEDEPF